MRIRDRTTANELVASKMKKSNKGTRTARRTRRSGAMMKRTEKSKALAGRRAKPTAGRRAKPTAGRRAKPTASKANQRTAIRDTTQKKAVASDADV